MAINNTAYDLDLFDEELVETSVAPKRREDEPVKKPKQKKKNNVYTFSEEDKYASRKRRHSPFKLIVGGVSAAIVTVVIGFIIAWHDQSLKRPEGVHFPGGRR